MIFIGTIDDSTWLPRRGSFVSLQFWTKGFIVCSFFSILFLFSAFFTFLHLVDLLIRVVSITVFSFVLFWLLWSIVLNDLWPKKIFRPKIVLIFILDDLVAFSLALFSWLFFNVLIAPCRQGGDLFTHVLVAWDRKVKLETRTMSNYKCAKRKGFVEDFTGRSLVRLSQRKI